MSDEDVLVHALRWMELFGGKSQPLQSQLGAVLVTSAFSPKPQSFECADPAAGWQAKVFKERRASLQVAELPAPAFHTVPRHHIAPDAAR